MAKGPVIWVNPPENKGKIARTDDGSNNEYEYNINRVILLTVMFQS